MYFPFSLITFCHLSGNFMIPRSKKFLSFSAKNHFRKQRSAVKVLPFNTFCKEQNKWLSHSAKSDEYGGCGNISHLSFMTKCV